MSLSLNVSRPELFSMNDIIFMNTPESDFKERRRDFRLPFTLIVDIQVLGSVEETPESVEAVFDQIRLLGQITDHMQEAEDLVAEMQERVDAIEEALADVEQGPRIFHEVDATLYTAAPGSFVGGLYKILKAQNIAAGAGQPFPQLTQEVIIERDPEVIILADGAYGESPDTVKGRAGWGNISAVRNDRIFVIDPDIVSRPGPRLVEALEALAVFLYPERFE